jgi:hypothetical protein
VTTAATRLHFSRFEFKYVLDRQLRTSIEAELAHFVELDPHVRDRPDRHYFVRSLYFDDEAHTAFHEKIEGMHTRSKFRLRTYAREADTGAPCFLEIKGRYNNLVFKHRTPLFDPVPPGLAGDALSRFVLDHTTPGSVQNQFGFELFRRRIRPSVLIDYQRRPYVSRFDPEFRVTFDEDLRTAATDRLFDGALPAQRRLLPGYTVMEVKFRHHVPAWFHRVIQAYELSRVSISKVCAGTNALGIALDPN